jgi:hypothetical protein
MQASNQGSAGAWRHRFVNCHGSHWCDAPKDYWGHKTFYIRCKRSGKRDVFVRMMEGGPWQWKPHRKRSRTRLPEDTPNGIGSASKKESRPPDRSHERRHEPQTARAVSDVDGRPLSFFRAARQGSDCTAVACSTICQKQSGCLLNVIMTPIGLGALKAKGRLICGMPNF